MVRISNKEIRYKREQVFIDVYSETNSPTKAIQVAYPAFKDKPRSASVKGDRLLKRPDIQLRIGDKLDKMAPKALKTVKNLLDSDSEEIRYKNSWRVIEHIRGTPINRNITGNITLNSEDVLANLK